MPVTYLSLAKRTKTQSGLTLVILVSVISFFTGPAEASGLKREGRRLFWGEKQIQLVGYSYYGLLGDSGCEPEPFIETLAAHNINFTRFFLVLPWPCEPGPNILPFARVDGKYDLRRFNDGYFRRLRRIVKRAEGLGIVCQLCLFDRCGLSTGDRSAWPNNPYNATCNVNGILRGGKAGYSPFCQTVGPIAEINSALIQKVVETTGDCGNVIYEIMNEPYPCLGPLEKWHAWVARELRKKLAGKRGSKVISSCGAYDDSEIDVFSMHSASSEQRVAAAIRQGEVLRKPVILSDDGDRQCMFRPDVMAASAQRALKLGQHFEHLEYTLTLKREVEKRPASRFNELPGICRLNLRTLSELSTPLLSRPFVAKGRIKRKDGDRFLSATLTNAELADRVIGERSQDGGRTWTETPLALENDHVSSPRLPGRRGARNLVRVVCIDRQSRRWSGPAYPYVMGNRWTVQTGDEVVEDGLLRVRPSLEDGLVQPALRGGLPCYEVNLRRKGKYAYFRLDDSFPRGAATRQITITIEFFDQPVDADLLLEYDGVRGPYTSAPPVPIEGSGTWRVVHFKIDDAIFNARQNDGADFRFSIQGASAPLALRSVSVQYY